MTYLELIREKKKKRYLNNRPGLDLDLNGELNVLGLLPRLLPYSNVSELL